ncbi:hypothetical protein [Vibrio agarivorans]|uniref:DUF2059 domain-containing protein n=1 Tax=Vibrio agarivorans TaxID=153622 RepID=A0ABT7Y0D5_9VIBR|nr:hypothetical protein [Vibrio agarivorans]MDN2481499.1 hypothetical protein [Vibrio agarivorans]
MKLLLMVTLFMFSSSAFSIDREAMVDEMMLLWHTNEKVEMRIDNFVSSLVELDSSIGEAYYREKYDPVIILARQMYEEAYKTSMSVYSDEELHLLLGFYRTDIGKQLSRKSIDSLNELSNEFVILVPEVYEAFLRRASELNSKSSSD